MDSYRDIALLKALYWRMMPIFRWLLALPGLTQTPIFSLVKDYANIVDAEVDSAIRATLNEPEGAILKANFRVLEDHFNEFMPAFVGDFTVNSFYCLDIYRGKSFTRQLSRVKNSLFSQRPMHPRDTMITMCSHDDQSVHLSIDQAMNLANCMSFNVFNLEDRSRFNPFRIHFNEC